jgi:tRNA A-37 threonylcarbamoyl transferase component Bud32
VAQRLDKYELLKPLGRGAAGTVYEAMDTVLNRVVAIKVVRLADKDELQIEELLTRFRLEAQVASRLRHSGVVGVHNYGEADGVAFIDMEYVDGETLKAMLDRGQRPTARRAVEIVIEVLTALDYCHKKGIVHRDIKPANIMLTKDGGVKLADFGIARIENSELTIVGTVMGTPHYMSPEQFAADQAIDFHTDIWSTGVVLYEMLTGAQPFAGDTLAAIRKQIAVQPFEPPSRNASGVPAVLDQVLARALRKTARDRFPTAAAFADALRAAMPDVGIVPPQRRQASAWRPRVGMLVAGGGVVAAACVAAFVWFGANWISGTEQPAAAPREVTAPEPKRSFSTETAPPAQTTPVPKLALNDPAPPVEVPQAEPETPPRPPSASIAAQLAAIPCSTVAAVSGAAPGTTVFRGVIGSGGPRNSFDAILWPLGAAAARSEVQTFPNSPTLCRMAELVRANDGGPGMSGVRLAMFNGRTSLVGGDAVRMSLRMPDFDGEIRVEDLNGQDQVLHLMEAVLGAPPRRRAGEQVRLGSDGSDMIGKVEPPFGAELVVAIVSSEPLFLARRVQGETPAGYLPALEAAVGAVRAHGGRVAMDAVVVTTGSGR